MTMQPATFNGRSQNDSKPLSQHCGFSTRKPRLFNGRRMATSGWHDPTLILYASRLHWSHGDEFCTQDLDYIAWREKSRSPEFAAHFLSLTLEQRQAFADQARDTSRENGKHTQSQIADVTPRSVPDGDIVHGHTHRPAVHRRRNGNRIVMGDWRPDAWVFVETHGFTGLKKWHQGWRAEIKVRPPPTQISAPSETGIHYHFAR